MGIKLKLLLAVASAAVSALGVMSQAAHAAPADGQAAVRLAVQQVADADDGCRIEAYTYAGRYMCGTRIGICPWEEVFVIAPNRTIWHVWPGSGGWKQMPNNGLADNMWKCYYNGNGQRQVEVNHRNGHVYYSYYSGGWRGWYRYPGS